MTEMCSLPSQYETDVAQTLQNRARLDRNANLLYWYQQLYLEQFRELPDARNLRILEIGSGVSTLRRFYPNVTTSDVLSLDYLDHVFDCHEIDRIAALPNENFDVITLTNVLHHLQKPLEFLQRAAGKLKHGGKLIATEPYFSLISTLIFKYLHHERVNFSISKPELTEIEGPLATANIAIPWLMFVKHPEWVEPLRAKYQFDERSFQSFSSISYMATGGISRRLPIPEWIYRLFFRVDLALSRVFPRVLASFFTIKLTRK
jgi:SAM-dependent methyltransferase